MWQNRSRDLCLKKLGPAELDKRMRKATKNSESGLQSLRGLVGSNKAKKMVANSSRNILRRCHGVGAIGYAIVQCDERIPKNDFFVTGNRFRLRFRHSNVNCVDDAACCQREAAIKFADRNEDGPLDLIFFTGRTAPARSAKGLAKVLKLTKEDEIREQCFDDPTYYFSLVDGLRRAPSSYAHLTYYSQMPYQFTSAKGDVYSARFRLIPGSEAVAESGLLDDIDQEHPWDTARRSDETRDAFYLRNEFVERLKQDEPIAYLLQIQLGSATDQPMWDPQKILEENTYPWLTVMRIELTTFLPSAALRQTFFNIVEKPRCLQFPSSSSTADPFSYQQLWTRIYTEFELKRKRQMTDDDTDVSRLLVNYEVTVNTQGLKSGRPPPVDICITCAGTDGRTTPRPLDKVIEQSPRDGRERYEIEAEDVGELLAVIVSVKYRQLSEDWYLRDITVSDPHDSNRIHRFPCHNIVLSKTTLRGGEACLMHRQKYEFHRQERLLDLSEKRILYNWQPGTSFPSQIKARTVQDLPIHEAQRANKFKGLLFQVDQELIDYFQNIRKSTSAGAAGLGRKMSLQFDTSGASEARMRRAIIRQLSVDISNVYEPDGGSHAAGTSKALDRWKKIKHQVKVISESKIPEGAKGEMCREVQNDVEFARMFVGGMNPGMIRRCTSLPVNFPVTEDMVSGILNRRKSLKAEIEDGRVYIADYSLLADIPAIHRDADHRYMVAPLVLLYVRANDDLVPLAIQLNQTPGATNPIWTPSDRPELWLLAKLWVRCADFQWGLAVAHYFRCHSLMEPFVVATARQLSSAHPVLKLLKPHFRYTLATNLLLRNNVFKKGCLTDRYTSLGCDGLQELISRYWRTFSFDELDPLVDFRARGVDDATRLPHYFYRDDSTRLWNSLRTYCRNILDLFYESSDDVELDNELHAWLRELHEVGFPGLTDSQRIGLPRKFKDIDQVVDLVAKVIFTLTCQHSATHTDCMDYLGYVPDIPAMMRLPPPDSREYSVDREQLTKILPDQFPDAYYGTVALSMHLHKPDENTWASSDEVYFVEPEAVAIIKEHRESLRQIAVTLRARNIIDGYLYENLMPTFIPNSAEPLPFVTHEKLKKEMKGLTVQQWRDAIFRNGNATGMPLTTMPLCRQFARILGGRSTISRRLLMAQIKQLKDSGPRGPHRPGSSSAAIGNILEADELDDDVVDSSFPTAKHPMRQSRLASSNF